MRARHRFLLLFGLAPLALAVGCADAPIFHDARDHPIGEISPRSSWSVSGTLADLEKAIDGDLTTAARSNNPHAGATLTLDLGKVCLFNLAAVDHGAAQMAFARRVEIRTSVDGRRFRTQYIAPGTRRVTALLLGEPVLARYVTFRVVEPGPEPWSVAEVYFQ